MENFKKIKAYRCNLMRFEAYSNRKIKVNLRLPVSGFFLWKSTQFTRILVESSNVHFFFQNTCLHAKCYIDSQVFYSKILSDNV